MTSLSLEADSIQQNDNEDEDQHQVPSFPVADGIGPEGGGMASVAMRIQQRAIQMMEEQEKLKDVTERLSKVQDIKQDATQKNRSVRKDLLQATRTCTGMELELYHLQDKIDSYKERIDKVLEEIKTMKREKKDLKRRWLDDVNTIYTPHIIKKTKYQTLLEGGLASHEQQSKEFVDEIEKAHSSVYSLKEEEDAAKKQIVQLKDEIKMLEEKERKENEEISLLATRVREALSKRSALRQSIRRAQQESQDANGEVRRWENECMELLS